MSKDLHKKDGKLFEAVCRWMSEYATIFNLPLRSIRPLEKKNCWYFGRCNHRGNIKIRVRKALKGRWEPRSDYAYQIIDTMAHELAHLRFLKHNNSWFLLHTAILEHMARDGVYEALRKL